MIHSTGTRMSNARPIAEQHHALGALHEPAARVVAQALGLGPLVGDRASRARPPRSARTGSVAAVPTEVPGDAAEDDRVGDAVGDRVEERATRGRPARLRGDRAVEQVDEPARGQADDARARGGRTR